jgi:hypothetical protein
MAALRHPAWWAYVRRLELPITAISHRDRLIAAGILGAITGAFGAWLLIVSPWSPAPVRIWNTYETVVTSLEDESGDVCVLSASGELCAPALIRVDEGALGVDDRVLVSTQWVRGPQGTELVLVIARNHTFDDEHG